MGERVLVITETPGLLCPRYKRSYGLQRNDVREALLLADIAHTLSYTRFTVNHPQAAMHLNSLVPLAAMVSMAAAVPLTQRDCTPAVRQEWRQLPRETQQSYVDAIKCLKTKPSRIGKNLTTTLYDDFPYVHAHLDTSSKSCQAWEHVYENTPCLQKTRSPFRGLLPSLASILCSRLRKGAQGLRL